MKKVAITGGIGAGKTTICQLFEKMGIPVFYADTEAKQLINTSKKIIEAFTNLFGADIYTEKKVIDRKKLAAIIFNDKLALQKVNGIVHPEVRKQFGVWTEQQNTPYVIQESAILFESKMNDLFDEVITVTAPLELKIERVVRRDGVDRDKVLERINNQIDDSEKIKLSDFVINTDGMIQIESQVIEIHKKILNL